MGRIRRLLTLCGLLLLLAPAAASGADGLFVPRPPQSQTVAPAGYSLSARDAVAVARRNDKVKRETARPGAFVRAFLFGSSDWLIRVFRSGQERVRLQIDGRSGHVDWAAAGREIDWPPIAHGSRTPEARRMHWAMLLAALLFAAPFVDPRRLRRLMHLDLLAIVGLGVPFWLAEGGHVYTATPLIYPPLLYLSARAIQLALRGPSTGERLSWMSPRLMTGALFAVVAARYGYDVIDGIVNDVGYASLYGADSILHGYALYDARSASGHLDAYGPLAYLAYIPFILIFPFHGLSHDATFAAKAAAMAFDLGTLAGLYALGRRLRPSVDGRMLGLALAWGFATCPWTLFVLARNTNDGLVALILTLVLLALASPVLRGVAVAAAAASKFAPLVVGALMARTGRERGLRPVLIYGSAVAFALVVIVVPYVPDGGIREFYDSTVGFQLSRTSPFSIWGLHPSWDPLRPVVTVAVAAGAAIALLVPRERSLPRIAAAGAALLIGIQLTAIHWYWFYVPWFLPYLLVALFSRSYAGSVRNSGSSSESAVATNR